MPRYFFDMHDGIHVIDSEGQELPDLKAAQAEAVLAASGYAISPRMLGEKGGAIVIVVRDGSDSAVMTVRLVFDISGPNAFSEKTT